MISNRICKKSITTCATSGAGTDYHSGAIVLISALLWSSCCSLYSFLCNILFDVLSLFSWPLELSALFRFTACHYRIFGLFKLFVSILIIMCTCNILIQLVFNFTDWTWQYFYNNFFFFKISENMPMGVWCLHFYRISFYNEMELQKCDSFSFVFWRCVS
jgi:hypothetical protein